VPQALLRAAENVRKLAEQTGTKLVVKKPSEIKGVSSASNFF